MDPRGKGGSAVSWATTSRVYRASSVSTIFVVLDVQRRQVELAKKYGIFGFCFHYYWFGGKRLLDLPLKQFLDNPELDFPFCLCWANENWTRRWDGLDNEVLIAQAHSPQDDLAFIESVEPMLRDKRYIRVNGRPLLIVYRPSLLPDPRQTAQRWRDYWRKASCGGLYLVAVQAFETVDPRPLGFDAAVEFPPHKLAEGAPVLNSQMEIVNPDYQGVICDYSYMVESRRRFIVRTLPCSEGFVLHGTTTRGSLEGV